MASLLSPQSLITARLQLHYAIQPIAAVGAALLPSQPDGSHASFTWNSELDSFVGYEIQAKQTIRVALNPVNLRLEILDQQSNSLAGLPLHEKTLEQALKWIKEAISSLGADSSQVQLLSYPPDDFPDHPIAHGAPFDASHPEARAALANFYAISHSLLQAIVTQTASASPVRIWSHHFDIATLITQSTSANGDRTLGVGFSPGDTSYSEPYWYVSPYPYPNPATLPDLAGTGDWHTQDWVGAVLTASKLNQDASERDQIDQIQTFLNHAIDILE